MDYFLWILIVASVFQIREFGLAIGIQMLMWGISGPIFGIIADKYGGHKAITIAFVFFILGVYLLYTGPNTGIFFQINLGLPAYGELSMNILLYNPDNEVTNNYMPHLWMFVLQAVTPPEHRVFLIDGNAQPMTEKDIARFVRENDIQLAGIGAMTRMAVRAYRMADAIRAAGAKVVMGGPHVTEVPDEPFGRTEEPRHADAVALGEADYLWPQIVRDTERGELKEVYRPVDEAGVEVKPSLEDYPKIPWERLDLDQFDLIAKIPRWGRYLLDRVGTGVKSFQVVPIESGRGCPYGCDFCTVTGFFGDSIRFRSNQSVVDEMLRPKGPRRCRG